MSLFPCHGGDLTAVSAYWNIPFESWLDLSTGINPYAYPLETVPESVWRSLPYEDYGLADAAERYFKRGVDVVVPGSQFAIEQIPRLLSPTGVAIPKIGYSEHCNAWQAVGHTVCFYESFAHLLELSQQNKVKHCVLINPNNPNATDSSKEDIRQLLASCKGYCVLDEAFRDVTHKASALTLKHERLVVLRSLGKFFGLAGVRIGFVFANVFIRQGLKQSLGLWPIPAPSLWAASCALNDVAWQYENRNRMAQLNTALELMLQKYLPANWQSVGLFITAKFEKAKAYRVYEALAQQGILIRYFDLFNAQALLRFGLPTFEQMPRLESGLKNL